LKEVIVQEDYVTTDNAHGATPAGITKNQNFVYQEGWGRNSKDRQSTNPLNITFDEL
jgi:hypothetical protein